MFLVELESLWNWWVKNKLVLKHFLGDYGHKQSLSSDCALGLGLFTAIIPSDCYTFFFTKGVISGSSTQLGAISASGPVLY